MTDDPRGHLRRDPQSATGLSFLQGEPVTGVGDLPGFHVEIHGFRDADRAQAFVDGLGFAKANGVAWTWEPESRIGMRWVVAARLSDDRSPGDTIEDAIALVVHEATDWEAQARAAGDAERTATEKAARQADRIRMQPLRDAFREAGIPVGEGALNWVRAFDGGVVVQQVKAGLYEVDCGTSISRREGDEPLLEKYAAHVSANGFHLDPANPYELRTVAVHGAAEAVRVARRMSETVDGFVEIASRFWHARFMETMRVTPNIRKFIAGAARDGVMISYLRQNPQARAGGVLLKRSEISRLVSAGWLARDDEYFPRKIEVTEAGLAAAGIRRDPTAAVGNAA